MFENGDDQIKTVLVALEFQLAVRPLRGTEAFGFWLLAYSL